ncbi:TetR/AcrR family transcriptional regulator [Actinomycetospora flava]|uniref:TetR/AcrR family transcriptional regulator n=1 Tax=Actinomycetospora flava TaxID=3129232 RepID=A0ABU8M1N3_9PSEU
MSRRYHHGDLAATLVDEGVALVAEVGVAGFSVAELARRAGVSTAAPYRHFGDRDRLLAAVATRVARELAACLEDTPGEDPAARLAAATGTYVAFVTRCGVGIEIVYAPALRRLGDEDLAHAGRAAMDVLIGLAREVRPSADAALLLVEQLVALAHGYASLGATGLTAERITDEDAPTRATRAARALIGAAPEAPLVVG